MGDFLRNLLSTVFAAMLVLLMLTACSSKLEPSPQTTASPAPSVSTPHIAIKSLEESCIAMMGDEIDGPIYEARAFLADPDMVAPNPEFVPQGLRLYETQREIFASAPNELARYTEVLIAPFADINKILSDGGGQWTFEAEPYSEALDAVTRMCVEAGTPVGDVSRFMSSAPATLSPSPSQIALPSSAPKPTPTPTPEPTEPPEPPTVVYEVNGDGGTALQVSWGTMNGLNGFGIEQATEPTLPFRVEVPLEELGRYQNNIFTLSAQDNGAGSFISCKISWKSTGVVLAEQSSTGPYSLVMCSK